MQYYLAKLKKNITVGSVVRGYFKGATTDNFEWAQGRPPPDGFFRVDYETQERMVKNSVLVSRFDLQSGSKIMGIKTGQDVSWPVFV